MHAISSTANFIYSIKSKIMPNLANLTPFIDDDKRTIIDHINEEHDDELQAFAKYLLDLNDDEQKALKATHLLEIYQQGIELELKFTDKSNQRFLAFHQPIKQLDDLNQAYVSLLQASDAKQGKKTIQLMEQQFILLDSYFVTENMFRLVLQAPHNAPLTHAGYAYLYNIDIPQRSDKNHHRYYTLRKAFIQQDKIVGWVDIFIHDSNAGGEWAKSLKKGDIITSKREFPERLEHLQQGQTLLIADETSLPTVAQLLEVWQNPLPPFVIVFAQDAAEHRYLEMIEKNQIFNKTNVPKIFYLFAKDDGINHTIDEQVIQIIKVLQSQSIKIDKVWGGLNADTIKSLRRKLLPLLGLTRENAMLKVYWRS